MATNDEYALLAAYANSLMTDQSLQQGTGGQVINNFILPAGWRAQEITLDSIQDMIDAQPIPAENSIWPITTADFAGMGALVFQRMVDGVPAETVISFRGTQFDEGILTGPGLADAIADMYLGTGNAPAQIQAAYWFYKAVVEQFGSSNLTFTGHSLGGALASILANYTGNSAVVFDAAPNVDAATEFRTNGMDAIAVLNDAGIIWPEIPPATASAGSVTHIVSGGDPLNIVFGDSGGGMLGSETVLPLNFDLDVFADSALEFVTDNNASLHSIYLVAFQQMTSLLGERSQKLLDLMTQVFNDDVNLRHKIGAALNMGDESDHRYDLFLRQLVNDKLNHGGVVTDMWLSDLGKLAAATDGGRLGIAGIGDTTAEAGIKSTFEWYVMRALIQTATQYAAQESIKQISGSEAPHTDGIISKDTADGTPAGILSADLSKLDEAVSLPVAQIEALKTAFLSSNPSLTTLSSEQQFLFGQIRHIVADAGADDASTLTGPQVSTTGPVQATLLAGFDGDDGVLARDLPPAWICMQGLSTVNCAN